MYGMWEPPMRNSNFPVRLIFHLYRPLSSKILNHQQSNGNYTVDLVTAIHSLEERFLDE